MAKEYNNLIYKYLIQQCKNPSGIIGSRMTAIWNKTFSSMTMWGLQGIQFSIEDSILDVGCGGGATVNRLSKVSSNGKVYGIDISAVAVKNAKKKNQYLIQRNKVEIIQAPVENLPFCENMFDKVFVIQTHMYWSDVEHGLQELVRILKPKGCCCIICEKDKVEYHLPKYKEWMEMVTLLKQVGFSQVKYKSNKDWVKYVCMK